MCWMKFRIERNEMTQQDLIKMEFHESKTLRIDINTFMIITRVHKGWIYTTHSNVGDQMSSSSVFVPR